MPKLFPIYLEVEQVAVGAVVTMLNKTPGVVHIDLERKKPKANGHAGETKPRGQYATGGDVEIENILFDNSPMTTNQLAAAFDQLGRSPKSVHSLVHRMKNDGVIVSGDDGYSLSKKARDRVRHRKTKKKKGGK